MLETEERKKMYEQAGISAPVFEYGEKICTSLKERFEAIDEMAEYNQLKVLQAFHKNRVSAEHMYGTTGYGYDDSGRDTLEKVYADIFHAEDALVRTQITCGTHALTLALSSILRSMEKANRDRCVNLESRMHKWIFWKTVRSIIRALKKH